MPARSTSKRDQPAETKTFLDEVGCGVNLYRDRGFAEAHGGPLDQAAVEALAMNAALAQAQTEASQKAAEPCPRRCTRKDPASPVATFAPAEIRESEARTAVFNFGFLGLRITVQFQYWYASATVPWELDFACLEG
jgi:hypothetical protein